MKDTAGIKPKDTEELDFLVSLQVAITIDVMSHLGLSPKLDVKTIKTRSQGEGIAFILRTLPQLFKDMLHVLETGEYDFTGTQSARTFGLARKNQYEIPTFLQGIHSLVLDKTLDDLTRARAFSGLYQICAWLYKYEFPFDKEALAKQYMALVELDKTIPTHFDSEWQGRVLHEANTVLRQCLDSLDLRDIRPSPGPGAVFPSCDPWEKYFIPYDDSMEEQYNSGDYFIGSPAMRSEGSLVDWEHTLLDCTGDYKLPCSHKTIYGPSLRHKRPLDYDQIVVARAIAEGLATPVERVKSRLTNLTVTNLDLAKVTAVPKNQTEARIINVENSLRMQVQQGQRRRIYDYVEHQPLMRGQVNFTDQTINGRLALDGSRTGYWATIDLKSASDLVGLALVRAIWPTRIVRQLEASRTTTCVIPDVMVRPGIVIPGGLLKMRKFAPMGSAVCFPVEAITFWAIAVAALLLRYDKMTLKEAASRVFVYGDDIIVPGRDCDLVCSALADLGLVVNKNKTFKSGPFRESCGVDAFLGHEVSPVRLKKPMPRGVNDAESLVSWIKIADSLFDRGYTRSAWLMVNHVESILGPLPHSPLDHFIGWRNSALVSEPATPRKGICSLFDINLAEEYMSNTSTHFGSCYRHCRLFRQQTDGNGQLLECYQASFSKVWVLRLSSYTPTPDELSDEVKYLRYWTYQPDFVHDFDVTRRLIFEIQSSDLGRFALSDTLVLTKVYRPVTCG